jgi:hypothetical protein
VPAQNLGYIDVAASQDVTLFHGASQKPAAILLSLIASMMTLVSRSRVAI